MKFARFWFNSFDKLVGPKPAERAPRRRPRRRCSHLSTRTVPDVDDEHATPVMQSVGQGNLLAADIRSLGLQGNQPIDGLVVARKGTAENSRSKAPR